MEYNYKIRNAFKLYRLAWKVATPLLRLDKRFKDGWEQRTSGKNLASADIWVQAASVGESYLAKEIIDNLKPSHPMKVLITTNTLQGHQILQSAIEGMAKRDGNVSAEAAYFPFDNPLVMNKVVNNVTPEVMVLLETEIWPGLLKALKCHGSKIFIINGRITEKSIKKYNRLPWLWNYLSPDNILAISEKDAERFRQLFAAAHIDVMPNIKFDRISYITEHGSKIDQLKSVINDHNPFAVFASVRQKEEEDIEKIIRYIKNKHPSVIIGLFPRHKHRIKAWGEILKKKGYAWQLRSESTSTVPGGTVILWDVFGELTAAYTLATTAFVGGSLKPLGGQNFLEAVACGVVPIIGPYWDDFSWVGEDIFELGIVKQASDWKEVSNMMAQSFNRFPSRKEILKNGLKYIRERQGGTDMACRLIENVFLS